MAAFLSLINDILQATIVIFGSAVVLYNLRHSFRDRVTRAFSALVTFVVITYLTELLGSRAMQPLPTEVWLHLEWVGIAMVPAAQYHLSDALLVTTGRRSRPGRLLVRVFYLTGVAFLVLVVRTDLIASELVDVPRAPHLTAGPLFPIFALYYWVVTAVSIYNVWRAWLGSITTTTRKRMRVILLASIAAPLGVFPYLLVGSLEAGEPPLIFWLVLIAGNVVVGFMFSLLTYYLAYFGAVSPDRVVRVRLFKFMARVPLTGTIVLLVYALVNRAGSWLGLPLETALAFAVVATVMLVGWAIHTGKKPLERWLQLNNDPDVRRIQELSERLLTTRDLHQFLESLLTAICNELRTPSGFIAAIGLERPKLEVAIGPPIDPEELWAEGDWQRLALPSGNSGQGNGEGEASALPVVDGFIVWGNYWIHRLYDRRGDLLLGILGVRARAEVPNLSEEELEKFDQLVVQAAAALEDRFLQQEVFAAVEGLLPEITELQLRRSAAIHGGADALEATSEQVLDDPEYVDMVRDALNHYWGGPKLTQSPLLSLQVVQTEALSHDGNPTNALRAILARAIEQQKPEGERNLTTTEWILYNILEMKFVQGKRVRDVARRLAMSESDLYRKQRIAIENVARAVSRMERAAVEQENEEIGIGSRE